MNRKSFVIGLALSCVIILGSGKADARKIPSRGPQATLLVTGLEGASGSTIGPGGIWPRSPSLRALAGGLVGQP